MRNLGQEESNDLVTGLICLDLDLGCHSSQPRVFIIEFHFQPLSYWSSSTLDSNQIIHLARPIRQSETAYSSSGTAAFSFASWERHWAQGTLFLAVNWIVSMQKELELFYKQLHICCGFCHFSFQVTINQCSCQQNWSLLWKDNSSSTVEGVGVDHCHFAHSVPAYCMKAYFMPCQGYETLASQLQKTWSVPLPTTVTEACALCSPELWSSCHTRTHHQKSHPINSIAMKRL